MGSDIPKFHISLTVNSWIAPRDSSYICYYALQVTVSALSHSLLQLPSTINWAYILSYFHLSHANLISHIVTY